VKSITILGKTHAQIAPTRDAIAATTNFLRQLFRSVSKHLIDGLKAGLDEDYALVVLTQHECGPVAGATPISTMTRGEMTVQTARTSGANIVHGTEDDSLTHRFEHTVILCHTTRAWGPWNA
jgi:hypothetical protein